jgi:hypothetical protein
MRTSLEQDVIDFAKEVNDIFEQQLKIMEDLREAFRIASDNLLRDSQHNELPPMQKIGVNKN